ncbi:MAG: hypothetical protein ABIH76_08900, partial [Candidatus Bathyarchaeota archaeon]
MKSLGYDFTIQGADNLSKMSLENLRDLAAKVEAEMKGMEKPSDNFKDLTEFLEKNGGAETFDLLKVTNEELKKKLVAFNGGKTEITKAKMDELKAEMAKTAAATKKLHEEDKAYLKKIEAEIAKKDGKAPKGGDESKAMLGAMKAMGAPSYNVGMEVSTSQGSAYGYGGTSGMSSKFFAGGGTYPSDPMAMLLQNDLTINSMADAFKSQSEGKRLMALFFQLVQMALTGDVD